MQFYKNKFLNRIGLFYILIILFIGLLILKIFGYCDYTAKYDIEEISCNQKFYNSSFVLDNDLKTIWGLTEKHHKNEPFIFKFRKIKDISSLQILTDEKKYPFPKIDILSSNDKKNWHLCQYDLSKINNGIIYEFKNSCKGKYLSLVYMEDTPSYWAISEIMLYEKNRNFYAFITVFSIILYLFVSFCTEANIIIADGRGYYEYFTKFFINHDFKTAVHFKYPIGTALLELPFLLFAQLIAKIFNLDIESGYSILFQKAVLLSANTYCVLGLVFYIKLLKSLFAKKQPALPV